MGDSLGRPDSLGPVDDDEDRIPQEELLKYVVSGYINAPTINQIFKHV